MKQDPIVEEVRSIRDRLAAGFNYDLKAIFADMRQREKAHGSRLVRLKPRRAAKVAAVK